MARKTRKPSVVEKKLVGGECPYWGCIPSKVMVRAGLSLAEAARVTGLAGDMEAIRTVLSPEEEDLLRKLAEVRGDEVAPPEEGFLSRLRSAFK